MTDKRKITRELIAAKPWGEKFLREMDLVIAANIVEAFKSHQTLYNDLLNNHIATLVAPLDEERVPLKLDVIEVPESDQPYKRLDKVLEPFKDLPRGHWAVLKMDDKYDAYMADGYGGIGTQSGYKFQNNSASAPDLNEIALYASVLSYMIYDRRNEIENAIWEHTFQEADIKPGQKFKNMPINGRESNVTFERIIRGYYVGKTDAVEVSATRRGVSAKNFVMPVGQFARKLDGEPVLPPEFVDDGNEARVIPAIRKPRPEPEPGTVVVYL